MTTIRMRALIAAAACATAIPAIAASVPADYLGDWTVTVVHQNRDIRYPLGSDPQKRFGNQILHIAADRIQLGDMVCAGPEAAPMRGRLSHVVQAYVGMRQAKLSLYGITRDTNVDYLRIQCASITAVDPAGHQSAIPMQSIPWYVAKTTEGHLELPWYSGTVLEAEREHGS